MNIEISASRYSMIRLFQKAETTASNLLQNAIPGQLSIIGAYNGNNIGDVAMGLAIKSIAKKKGIGARFNSFGDLRFAPRPRCTIMGGGELGTKDHYAALQKWAVDPSLCAIIGVNTSKDLDGYEDVLIDFLKNVAFISQRTRSSTAYLSAALGRAVYYQPDIAFSYPDVFGLRPAMAGAASTFDVGLSFCPIYLKLEARRKFVPDYQLSDYFRKHNEDMYEALPVIGMRYVEYCRSLTAEYIKKGYKLAHIPFSPLDALFADAILDDLDVTKLAFSRDPSEVFLRMRACKAIFATRFHAHVFSLAAGVPLVSFSYSGKCESLWSDLGLPIESQTNRLALIGNIHEAVEHTIAANSVVLDAEEIKQLSAGASEVVEAGISMLQVGS